MLPNLQRTVDLVTFTEEVFNGKLQSLCSVYVYDSSEYSTREQVARGRFFKGLQMKVKENKITLGDFNCTMDKMDRYGGNKTQKLYRYCANYALILDNGLRIYGKGRTQIPVSSPTMIGPVARIQNRQGLY